MKNLLKMSGNLKIKMHKLQNLKRKSDNYLKHMKNN